MNMDISHQLFIMTAYVPVNEYSYGILLINNGILMGYYSVYNINGISMIYEWDIKKNGI